MTNNINNMENQAEDTKAERNNTGKTRRVLAIVGVVLLCGMYLASFLLAIFDNTDAQRMFFASVAATIIIPVLIWAYTFIYKLLTKDQAAETGKDSADTGDTRDSDDLVHCPKSN